MTANNCPPQPQTALVRGSAARSSLAALAGFVGYGGWAVWINSQHSVSAGISAGLVQGSYSLLLTFCMTFIMEILWRQLRHVRGRLVLTIGITGLVILLASSTLHWLFKTPEILLTILPGLIIGLVYTTGYIINLARLQRVAPSLQETEPCR